MESEEDIGYGTGDEEDGDIPSTLEIQHSTTIPISVSVNIECDQIATETVEAALKDSIPSTKTVPA